MRVSRGESPLVTLRFSIPPCGAPSTYATLPTPSGEPTRVFPEHRKTPVAGGFVSFLRPRRGAPQDLAFLILSVVAGGKEIGGALSCTCASYSAVTIFRPVSPGVLFPGRTPGS